MRKKITFLKFLSLRDVFILFGLFILGYGLYLYKPWVSFAVIGLLVFVLGLLMRDKSG